MLGQLRPQRDDDNLTVSRSWRLHQVTVVATTSARRLRPSAESGAHVGGQEMAGTLLPAFDR
jgi:hypothetical protein